MRGRTLEILKELKERDLDREAKWRLLLTRYIERHKVEMVKVKKKQYATTVVMSVLVSIIMNKATYTMNDDSVSDIEDCNEFDL